MYRAVRAGVYAGLLAYYSTPSPDAMVESSVTPADSAQHRRPRLLAQLNQARRTLFAALAVFVIICLAVLFLLAWWAATLATKPGPPFTDTAATSLPQTTQHSYSVTQQTAFDF